MPGSEVRQAVVELKGRIAVEDDGSNRYIGIQRAGKPTGNDNGRLILRKRVSNRFLRVALANSGQGNLQVVTPANCVPQKLGLLRNGKTDKKRIFQIYR